MWAPTASPAASGSEAAISRTETSTTTARQLAVGAVATATLALAGLVPAWIVGETRPLIGSPAGEVWGHAWVQWWHADALPHWPDGPGAWLLDDRKWAVIDPLTTLFAATLGALVDPIFARYSIGRICLGETLREAPF